jgi:hypothetical protein
MLRLRPLEIASGRVALFVAIGTSEASPPAVVGAAAFEAAAVAGGAIAAVLMAD